MTITSWSTTETVPPGPWAQLVADVRRLLAVMTSGGSTVTGPAMNGGPLLDAERIDFVVTAPASQPLAVAFTRAPGEGTVTTNAPHTDGLVLVALERAARHWGLLLTWTTDASSVSRAVASMLVEQLFGRDDRAVSGGFAPDPSTMYREAIDRAMVAAGDPPPGEPVAAVAGALQKMAAQITAERAGVLVAAQVLAGLTTPLPSATTPAAS